VAVTPSGEQKQTQKYTWSRSYQTFFSPFFFFVIKLGHSIIFFCMYQKRKLTSKKRKNSSLAKKKSLVGSTPRNLDSANKIHIESAKIT